MKLIIPKELSLILIFTLSFLCELKVQTEYDNNIIIENSTEVYSYRVSYNQVSLEQKTSTRYISTKWPETITFAEFYDLYSSIKNVKIKASKKVVPTYQMYLDRDIFYDDLKVCFF